MVEPEERAFIRRAIQLSRTAMDHGNTPFGSVLVVDDDVIREAENTTITDDDITAHPELHLARWAARSLDPEERRRCTMYTSTEPCAMCAAAIVYAGLGRVVYAVRGAALAEVRGREGIGIPCLEVIERAQAPTTVLGPVLEKEGLAVHREHF